MEIPLKHKYTIGFKSRHKSTSSNGGTNKHRGETDSRRRAFAMAQTLKYKKVMLLQPNGKRKFVPAAELGM